MVLVLGEVERGEWLDCGDEGRGQDKTKTTTRVLTKDCLSWAGLVERTCGNVKTKPYAFLTGLIHDCFIESGKDYGKIFPQ